ncbi:MAG TPA: plastocyanin/azurin family copper-binding protein [Euzebyales bacterium]|nr:plastocyanin/azurin family copper-binding protein [Euzebyales bacterium]
MVLVLLSGAVLAWCGRADDTGEVRIGMLDDVFTRDGRVPVGTDVVFRNLGRTVHNAVTVDGSWSTADTYGADVMPVGASTTVTVDDPGVYRFYCTLHGTRDGDGMYATLVVGDVAYTGDPETEPQQVVGTASAVTRRVPEPHDTIQDADDAADPGDLVLVGPGVYQEEVWSTRRRWCCAGPTATR